MRKFCLFLLIAAVVGPGIAAAQAASGEGAILVKGRAINAGDKSKPSLVRKRFFLFPGSLKDNKPLVDRIKAAEITSRDCYYAQAQASPCFIKWLQEQNCETPFCRKVEEADIKGVKEFEDAYAAGLTKYNRRPDIALSWLVNNLAPALTGGFYLKQRAQINAILGGQKELQSTMTTSTGVEATFVGVPTGEKATKYVVSNVLPIEVGAKSFVWACEVDVQNAKQTALALSPDPAKKNCVLTIRELTPCSTGTCERP